MEPEAYAELNLLEENHWWYRGMRSITASILYPVLNKEQNLLILDAGCGAGGNLQALKRYGTTLGFDYSPLALHYARQHHSNKLTRASVETIPFARDTFDLVTSFDVIYCYEVGDDVRALSEFARVTRPGGYVLLRVPAMPALAGSHDVVVHGVRRYVAAELEQKLELAELQPLRVSYANSLLLPAIFTMRKIQNLLVGFGAKPDSDVKATPELLNASLTRLLEIEARWISGGRNFPAGVSLFALAAKPV